MFYSNRWKKLLFVLQPLQASIFIKCGANRGRVCRHKLRLSCNVAELPSLSSSSLCAIVDPSQLVCSRVELSFADEGREQDRKHTCVNYLYVNIFHDMFYLLVWWIVFVALLITWICLHAHKPQLQIFINRPASPKCQNGKLAVIIFSTWPKKQKFLSGGSEVWTFADD